MGFSLKKNKKKKQLPERKNKNENILDKFKVRINNIRNLLEFTDELKAEDSHLDQSIFYQEKASLDASSIFSFWQVYRSLASLMSIIISCSLEAYLIVNYSTVSVAVMFAWRALVAAIADLLHLKINYFTETLK